MKDCNNHETKKEQREDKLNKKCMKQKRMMIKKRKEGKKI